MLHSQLKNEKLFLLFMKMMRCYTILLRSGEIKKNEMQKSADIFGLVDETAIEQISRAIKSTVTDRSNCVIQLSCRCRTLIHVKDSRAKKRYRDGGSGILSITFVTFGILILSS